MNYFFLDRIKLDYGKLPSLILCREGEGAKKERSKRIPRFMITRIGFGAAKPAKK